MTINNTSEAAKAVVRRNTEEVQGGGNYGKPTRERNYTIAILALDWEDKLGLGMECPRATRTFYALETGLLGWAERNPGTFRPSTAKSRISLASSMQTQSPGSLA